MVQAIANETFADLFSGDVPLGEVNWFSGWVALFNHVIIGVTVTRDEWVTDLWVRRENRRRGVGALLLARAESEIAERGHKMLRLRVVKSNSRAVRFYQTHGWRVHREFAHEKYEHQMFEMIKLLPTLSQR